MVRSIHAYNTNTWDYFQVLGTGLLPAVRWFSFFLGATSAPMKRVDYGGKSYKLATVSRPLFKIHFHVSLVRGTRSRTYTHRSDFNFPLFERTIFFGTTFSVFLRVDSRFRSPPVTIMTGNGWAVYRRSMSSFAHSSGPCSIHLARRKRKQLFSKSFPRIIVIERERVCGRGSGIRELDTISFIIFMYLRTQCTMQAIRLW